VLALGSDFAKSFAFVFDKGYDVFLHTQSSQVDYEENIPHALRHYKLDMTLEPIFLIIAYAACNANHKNPPEQYVSG
jgi:hypothetical protein